MTCWINIFRGLYAKCSDGSPFYISPIGYRTKKDARMALYSPKTKGIRDRYIATIKITF